MDRWQITRGGGIEALHLTDAPGRPLAPDEVRVALRAASLNYRDLAIARGEMGPRERTIVPGSDGVGVVVEAGRDVRRVTVGERVVMSFFPRWLAGRPTAEATAAGLGGALDGVLAREHVAHEDAVVVVPDAIDDTVASTLPCAGLTAWHALSEIATLERGAPILLLGTGGVSTFALALARAAGLRAIVTSSSAAKLAQARSLGAHATLLDERPREAGPSIPAEHSRTAIPPECSPAGEWTPDAVRALADGEGVALALDVGGRDTLPRALAATRHGGTVAAIGGLAGGFGASISTDALIDGAKRIAGVLVGSREMLERLVAFVAAQRIAPPIDRVFDYAALPAAYRHLANGSPFGKVVIRMP